MKRGDQRAACILLLLAHQVHWRADAFAIRHLGVRAAGLRAWSSKALVCHQKPEREAFTELRCSAGDILDPEGEDGRRNIPSGLDKAECGDEDDSRDHGEGDAAPPEKGGEQVRTRKAFQMAWKQKFKDKGADLSIPSKLEALTKLGREIETDPQALQDLRARLSMLTQRMESAVSGERFEDAAQLRDELHVQKMKDPMRLREELWKEMQAAGEVGDLARAASLRLTVQEVERFLPQYKLSGEWEGIYASHGKETVLIRYEGSTLVAVKMTGDENVPKGEITFTADLSPEGLLGPASRDSIVHPAEKIRLVLEGHLDNIMSFKGRGQVCFPVPPLLCAPPQRSGLTGEGCGKVARPGFKSPQFIDGQLLVFEEGILGFIFLPLASMIVFEVGV